MDLKKICLGCMREKPQASGKCPYCGFDTKIRGETVDIVGFAKISDEISSIIGVDL